MKGFLGLFFLIIFLSMSMYMERTNIKIKQLEMEVSRLKDILNVQLPPDYGAAPITKCDLDSMIPECVLEQMGN